MRRVLVGTVLAALLAVGLAGCGGGGEPATATPETTPSPSPSVSPSPVETEPDIDEMQIQIWADKAAVDAFVAWQEATDTYCAAGHDCTDVTDPSIGGTLGYWVGAGLSQETREGIAQTMLDSDPALGGATVSEATKLFADICELTPGQGGRSQMIHAMIVEDPTEESAHNSAFFVTAAIGSTCPELWALDD